MQELGSGDEMADDVPDLPDTQTPKWRDPDWWSDHLAKTVSGVVVAVISAVLIAALVRSDDAGEDPAPALSEPAALASASMRREDAAPSSSPSSAVVQLAVADFVVDRPTNVKTKMDRTLFSGETETETTRTAAETIQVALRNSGDAPAFIRRAKFNITSYELLEYCIPTGDPLLVTQSVDVQIPYKISQTPFEVEEVVSIQVPPNSLDRIEFTLSIPEFPPRPPAIAVVEVVLEQDTGIDLEVGIAKLAMPTIAAQIVLNEEVDRSYRPELRQGDVESCLERNYERLKAADQHAPEGEGRSDAFATILEAYSAYFDGN